jgi:hypothetical protein
MRFFRVPLHRMPLVRIVFIFAGVACLASVAAGIWIHPFFFYVPGLVGAMEIVFALSGYCPLAMILHASGIPCERKDSEESFG